MKLQQGIESLLKEVETLLNTDLPEQRHHYYEGARDYLEILRRMTADGSKRLPRLKRTQKSEIGSQG